MTAAAKNAFGAIFCMVAAPTAVVTATHKIAELISVQPPQWERGTIDVTTHDGASQAREFIAEGVYDAGEISGQIHYIVGSTGDTLMLGAMTAGTLMNCKCVLKAATGTYDLTFSGYLMSYQPDDMPVDGKQTASFTVKITGASNAGRNRIMTGTTPPLVPTVTFEFEGESYTAVADHMTIVRYERAADRSFGYALLHLERVQQIGEMPKFSELGFLVQAMLGEHHPDVGLDLAIRIAADPLVLSKIGGALGQAMPAKKDTARPLAKAAKAPPAKSGRKKSGTGKRSSAAG